MGLESSLNSKTFTTHITYKRLFPSVGPHVISQPGWSCKLFRTNVTLVRLVTTVGELMLHQVKWLDTGEITLVTLERLLAYNATFSIIVTIRLISLRTPYLTLNLLNHLTLRLRQILSKVFLSTNMQLELTKSVQPLLRDIVMITQNVTPSKSNA